MEKTFYRFLPYYFIAFTMLVIYCFFQSYYSHIPRFENVISPIGNVPITITTVTHFHAVMITLWLLMLIVQPILIVRKQFSWHRLLGKASYGLVSLLVLSILLVIWQEQTREKSLEILAANLLDLPAFLVMYAFAIYYRKKPAYHARFMMMSVVTFLDPALARLGLPGVFVGLGFWLAFFVVEFFTRKLYKPYLIGFGYYLANLAFSAYLLFGNRTLLERIWIVLFG